MAVDGWGWRRGKTGGRKVDKEWGWGKNRKRRRRR
jgi:hypothetical protein